MSTTVWLSSPILFVGFFLFFLFLTMMSFEHVVLMAVVLHEKFSTREH